MEDRKSAAGLVAIFFTLIGLLAPEWLAPRTRSRA